MPDSLHIALRVAFNAADVSEMERDAVLAAMVEHMRGPEAEVAARLLHHRREAATLQMDLKGLIEQRRAL